jgi:Ca2+-binding EF-hand superfamily protein
MSFEITDQQKEEFRAAFDIFVEDSEDGTISTKELGKVLRMLGQNPSEQELQEMVDEVDEDGSGTIDFDEFTQMMSKQLAAEALEQIPERPEKELAEAFRIFDKNCDGYLDFDEIKAVLDVCGEKFEEWEIKTFIAEGDKNDDGKMDYEEWIDIMKHTPQM